MSNALAFAVVLVAALTCGCGRGEEIAPFQAYECWYNGVYVGQSSGADACKEALRNAANPATYGSFSSNQPKPQFVDAGISDAGEDGAAE